MRCSAGHPRAQMLLYIYTISVGDLRSRYDQARSRLVCGHISSLLHSLISLLIVDFPTHFKHVALHLNSTHVHIAVSTLPII